MRAWPRGRAAQGFTLVELLVAILIIGILIAVAAPSFLGQTKKAHDSATQQYLTVAYKDATATAVSNSPQGYFVTGVSHPGFTLSDLRDAIQSGEPGLAVTLADDSDLAHSCPQIASGQPDNAVFIDSTGTHGNNLVMCADPNGRVWTLTVENGVLQPFPQAPYAGSSQPIVIAPTSISAPALSGTAQVGDSLSTSTGSWANSPTGYSYTWQSSPSADFSGTVTTVGTNSSSYTVAITDQGDYLRVSVQASNSGGSASVFSSNTSSQVPAFNTTPPSFSGNVQAGQTLTASVGSWTGANNLYAYTWESSSNGTDWAPVASGGTSSTYVVQNGDLHQYLRITVQATNAGGSLSISSSASGSTVIAETPSSSTPPSLSDNLNLMTYVQVADTLTADPGTWANCTGCGYVYTWQSSTNSSFTGTPTTVQSSSVATYIVQSGDLNKYVRVSVQATNANGGTASAYSSNQTSQILPETPSVSVAPSFTNATGGHGMNVQTGDVLNASSGSWNNCSGCSYVYTWQRAANASFSGTVTDVATGASYTVLSTDQGGYLRLSVQATNGNGGTASALSSNQSNAVAWPTSSASLTASGNEITDATRASSLAGDGRSNDSSTGVWNNATNMIPDGGFEASLGSWLPYNWYCCGNLDPDPAIARVSSEYKFGNDAMQINTGTNTGWKGAYYTLPGTLTNGVTYVASAWVKGTTTSDELLMDGTGNSQGIYAPNSAGWTRVSVPFVGTGNPVSIYLRSLQANHIFYVDGVQVEQQGATANYPTPYIETSAGAASRAAGRLQVPASLFTTSQGWMAFRVRVPSNSTTSTGVNNFLFNWATSSTNRISVIVGGGGALGIEVQRASSAGLQSANSTTTSFQAGDLLTIVAVWTPTLIEISVNGGSFVVNNSTPTIPDLSAAPNMDIGSYDGSPGGAAFDGDFLWMMAGRGTIGSTDLAALNALGNSDPSAQSFGSPALPTMLWDGLTSSYTRISS